MAALSPHDSAAVPTVPLALEQYARTFDDLFHTHIQRRRFREYLAGLLMPRDRNKTLTALVGAEPITQAQTAPVQQLQFFLSEADWEAVTARRLEDLQAGPLTTPHADGALVIDETGDRKEGTHTAHVGYQYLGSIGTVASWATAAWPSLACGRTSGCITRSLCAPTRRPHGSRVANRIPCFTRTL
jgi:SRSO17 transposase